MRSVRIQRDDGTETITIYGLGEIRTAHSDHPNFMEIKTATESTEEPEVGYLESLFDVAKAIQRNFERLTDRISVRGEDILLDLEPVHTVLGDAILHTMSEGEDFTALVNFMEKLEANPNPKSRDALYTWLDHRNMTITPEGDVVGYKGVSYSHAPKQGEHVGIAASGTSGHAFVDGVEYGADKGSDFIPYPIGSIVEMPRSEVVNDSQTECSQGLHVGTFSFASSYSQDGLMLEVHVDPRDVVSVPNIESSSKFRCCRLKVIGTLDKKYDTSVRHPDPEPEPEVEELPEDYFSGQYPEDVVLDESMTTTERDLEAETAAKNEIMHVTNQYGMPVLEWDNDPQDGWIAKLGRAQVIVDDEDEGLFKDDEGELHACVVGAVEYHNRHVKFFFTPDGVDTDLACDPSVNVETIPDDEDSDYSGPQSWRESVDATPISVPQVGPAHPGPDEFNEMMGRARRRRQSIVPYIEHTTAKEATAWKYSGEGDSTDRLYWKKETA